MICMPINKRHLLFAAALVVILYLVLQYHVHLNIISFKLSNEQDSVEVKESNDAHLVVGLFMDVCHSLGLPTFIIDQRVLLALNGNEPSSKMCGKRCPTWCKFLCSDHQMTSLGIYSNMLRNTEKTYDDFRRKGFTITVFNQTDDFVSVQDASEPVHLLFTHEQGHTVHLVVFYIRGKDYRFVWHGRLLQQPARSNYDLANVTIGQYDGAYDRFDLVKIKLDGVKVRVPKNITRFLSEMTASKFIECNHQGAEHFYKEYGQKETTADAKLFYKAARNILVKAKNTLDSMNVRFWLSSGTCLGWFRQCDFIPYSKDVDIGIWITDYKDGVIQGLQDSGLTLIHQFGKVEDSFELSFTSDVVKLDIFFFYAEEKYMWNGGTQARTGLKFKYIFPPFTLCWTEFLLLKVRIPCDTQSYVMANYGENWFQPVKSWDWKKSPPNVQSNGEWPQQERSFVIQQLK